MSEEETKEAEAPAAEGEAAAEEKPKGNLDFEDVGDGSGAEEGENREIDAIHNIPVEISAVLGHAKMEVSQLLKLGRGAVVELDRKVGEAIDIYVNNRLVARGEVVVVEDRLGITMTEIIKSDRA